MSKIVELRQDRGLIQTNFDGYKLSLDSIPLLKQDLASPPLCASPNDDQYSLLHAELFAMQNLLQPDPWSRTQCYFVNSDREIQRICYNEATGRPDAIQMVFRLNKNVVRQKGDYNYTFRFVSEKYSILCDGIKTLTLFDTGDRFKAAEWQSVAECAIEATTIDSEEERNYVIYDARLDIQQEQRKISLALAHVQKVVTDQNQSETAHYMYLHWAKMVLKEQTWSLEILETLETKGSVYYCAFEPKAESLIISCNREIQWRSKKVSNEKSSPIDNIEEKPQLHDQGEVADYDFSWSQTEEDVVVKFCIKPGKDKTDYNIKCLKQRLSVQCAENVLLDEELFSAVDKDMTTWTVVSFI